MKEVVLHIGMHKGGSSAIQKCLDGYDDGRRRYARLGDANHSVPLYTLFSTRYRDYHIHVNAGLSTARIDALRERASAALERELSLDRDALMISGEDLSTLEREGVRALRDFLLARVERVKVVAYVRDPFGFASSAIGQYAYGGMRTPHVPTPRYRERFESYLELFGAGDVEFVKFDRATLCGGSVVPDFCRRAGIDADAVEDDSVNESLSRELVQLLLRFNRDGMPSQGNRCLVEARRRLVRQLRTAFDGPAMKLSPAAVIPQLDREDVDWMERAAGIALGEGADVARAGSSDRGETLDTLLDIDDGTLLRLRELVGAQDETIARSAGAASLLDYLFMSCYFRVRRERAPGARLVEGASRLHGHLRRAVTISRGRHPG